MLTGACTGHSNPDLWFPEFTKQGKPSNKETEKLMDNAIYALSFCERCPVKDDCLEIGMRYDNLENGIWGGSLPGERLVAAGRSTTSTQVMDAVVLAERIRERVRIWESL
jgi:hypothetical protein